MNRTLKIGITMGDPGGIGPEIIFKALAGMNSDFKEIAWIVFGKSEIFSGFCKSTGLVSDLSSAGNLAEISAGGTYLFDISQTAQRLLGSGEQLLAPVPGKVHAVNAALAFAALEEAAKAACAGQLDAIVTAPVNKTSMRLLDPGFTGHTEYLAAAAGVSNFAMSFISPRLKVTLATIHVALKNVSSVLDEEGIYKKILLTHEALKKYSAIKQPRLAVCALNPHGRETGTEEDQIILPAVERAAAEGIHVKGPFSADQLFHEAYQENRYDALIAMYHDQALAPFKMIAFHEGVNVTLGLPFVRTSPDHGTAFDLAGKHQADARSMSASLRLAAEYVQTAARGTC